MITSMLLGIAGGLLLQATYAALSSEWPEHYSSARTALERSIRRGPIQYVAVRIIPVYLVTVLTGTTASQLGLSGSLAALHR